MMDTPSVVLSNQRKFKLAVNDAGPIAAQELQPSSTTPANASDYHTTELLPKIHSARFP